jgi:hypothetical protein
MPQPREVGVATATLRDETATGRELGSTTLADLPAMLTARELVRLRVREQVAAPGWEARADAAEAAFDRNGFVLLVGERQVESLDEVVSLTDDPVISFVRLVPLVGG